MEALWMENNVNPLANIKTATIIKIMIIAVLCRTVTTTTITTRTVRMMIII